MNNSNKNSSFQVKNKNQLLQNDGLMNDLFKKKATMKEKNFIEG